MWYRRGKTASIFMPKSEYERALRTGDAGQGADSIEVARQANRGEAIYAIELPEESVEWHLKSYAPLPGAGYHLQVPSGRISAAVDERCKVTAAHPSYNDMLYNYSLERVPAASERRVAGVGWMLQRLSRQLKSGTQMLMVDNEEDTSVTWAELIQSAMHGTDWKGARRTRLAEFTAEGFEIASDTLRELELCASMLAEHRHEHDAADVAAAIVARAAAVMRKYAGTDARMTALASSFASEAIEDARAHLSDFKNQSYSAGEEERKAAELVNALKAEEEYQRQLKIKAHNMREKNRATAADIMSNREKGYMYATTEPMNERRVAAGETDEIRFPSCPGAGFTWSAFDSCQKLPSAMDVDFEPEAGSERQAEPLIGGGGYDVFRIRFDEPGTYEMRFRYGRPWEGATKTESIRYVVS